VVVILEKWFSSGAQGAYRSCGDLVPTVPIRQYLTCCSRTSKVLFSEWGNVVALLDLGLVVIARLAAFGT
jgi:hypothetical protein